MELPADIDAAFEALENHKDYIDSRWRSETQAAQALSWTQSTLNRLLKTKQDDLDSARKQSTFVKNVKLLGMSIRTHQEHASAGSSGKKASASTVRRPFLVFGSVDDPIMAFYPDMIDGKWVLMGEIIKPLSVPVGESFGIGFAGKGKE